MRTFIMKSIDRSLFILSSSIALCYFLALSSKSQAWISKWWSTWMFSMIKIFKNSFSCSFKTVLKLYVLLYLYSDEPQETEFKILWSGSWEDVGRFRRTSTFFSGNNQIELNSPLFISCFLSYQAFVYSVFTHFS